MDNLDLRITQEEKLQMYHFILDACKGDPKQAAVSILGMFSQFLKEKEEKAAMVQEGIFSEQKGKTFRRVG